MLYAQRLLEVLGGSGHEVSVILSRYAPVVIKEELRNGLEIPDGASKYGPSSMHIPCASGSNTVDVMVVIPCSMGAMGRIAHGYSNDALARSADVVLKEKKKLILVPRETPLNLIHLKNMELLMLAGAQIIPANPSFYSKPQSITDLVDTVVGRVLDNMGIENSLIPRWQAEPDENPE